MFAFSLNIDPDKLKDAAKKNKDKNKKKGSAKAKKSRAEKPEAPDKDTGS